MWSSQRSPSFWKRGIKDSIYALFIGKHSWPLFSSQSRNTSGFHNCGCFFLCKALWGIECKWSSLYAEGPGFKSWHFKIGQRKCPVWYPGEPPPVSIDNTEWTNALIHSKAASCSHVIVTSSWLQWPHSLWAKSWPREVNAVPGEKIIWLSGIPGPHCSLPQFLPEQCLYDCQHTLCVWWRKSVAEERMDVRARLVGVLPWVLYLGPSIQNNWVITWHYELFEQSWQKRPPCNFVHMQCQHWNDGVSDHMWLFLRSIWVSGYEL